MFLNLLYEAIGKYIPRISLTNNKFSRKTTLNRSNKSKIRQKHRLWRLYLQTNVTNVYHKYRKDSDQIRLFMRQSIKNLEKNICDDIKSNPKKYENMLITKEKPM